MHLTLVLALLAVFGTVASADEPAAARAWTHTRPITPNADRLLAAAQRSPTVAALLRDLERTDVVVYLEESWMAPARPAAYLTFLATAAGIRYLRVHVDRGWQTPPWDRVAYLGHELQHALEVAADPGVRDDASLGRLYERIGWQGPAGRYETDAARRVTIKVRNEMAAPNLPHHSPKQPSPRVLPFD